jgi:hypothetical protein
MSKEAIAAIDTLKFLGYTYHGGEKWKPPLGPKRDFWEGYVPAIPAQQALDKKAENARELGLDYEPAQQEPVGEVGEIDIDEDGQAFAWLALHKNVDIGDKLYTSPPAQRTWVGLTDEELSEVYNQADWDTVNGWEYERAIEAKLKEKNNG